MLFIVIGTIVWSAKGNDTEKKEAQKERVFYRYYRDPCMYMFVGILIWGFGWAFLGDRIDQFIGQESSDRALGDTFLRVFSAFVAYAVIGFFVYLFSGWLIRKFHPEQQE